MLSTYLGQSGERVCVFTRAWVHGLYACFVLGMKRGKEIKIKKGGGERSENFLY